MILILEKPLDYFNAKFTLNKKYEYDIVQYKDDFIITDDMGIKWRLDKSTVFKYFKLNNKKEGDNDSK